MYIATKSRTLYAYSNTSKADDLDVEENQVLTTYPAKDNDDWVYGMIKGGKAGWLPSQYVTAIQEGLFPVSAVPFRLDY